MIKFNTILITLFLAFNGCSDKKTSNSINGNEKYLKFRNQFDSTLINHFPLKISSENLIISNTNSEKNDVGLFLFEYNLPESEIKNLQKKAIKTAIATYSTKDVCFLKVNTFETKETKENLEIVEITDSTLINKPCYKNLLPIPNFIDFTIASKSDFWSDKNFSVYVLEAKSGSHFKEFDLQANPQMPEEWKNGFSKGIAVNKEKKTVIYWSIIW